MKRIAHLLNSFTVTISLFSISCSTTNETKKIQDLQKWVGNYFYGGDENGMGIILTIDSIGNSIRGRLSDGSEPQVLRVGEDGSVFVSGQKANLLNDTIRFSFVFSEGGDTTYYNLPRVTDEWIKNLMAGNDIIKEEKKYVKIGSQVWMVSNLDVKVYNNGDAITEAQNSEEWKKCNEEKIGCWCYYNNFPNQGVLYNWYALIDSRGLAPKGSKIPTHNDFMTLANFLGGEGEAGILIKSDGFHPPSDRHGVVSGSGFNAVGTGYRESGWGFRGAGEMAFYWALSSNGDNPEPRTFGLYARSRRLHTNVGGSGLSVRCIKLTEGSSKSELKVSARLIYEDGSLSDFDILNDKSVILWNVVAGEGDDLASSKTRFIVEGNTSNADIMIMNDDGVLYTKQGVRIDGKNEIDVNGTGCGKLTIQIMDNGKIVYSGGAEFGCGE